MEAVVRIHRCALCRPGRSLPATTQCRQCWRWLCPDHAGFSEDGTHGRASELKASGGIVGPCEACASDCRAFTQRSYVATRLAIVSGASVAGMVGGAIAAMLISWAFDLPGVIAVLSMLLAEIAGGSSAGRMVDKRVDRWLERRACASAGRFLPRARALGPRRARRFLRGSRSA